MRTQTDTMLSSLGTPSWEVRWKILLNGKIQGFQAMHENPNGHHALKPACATGAISWAEPGSGHAVHIYDRLCWAPPKEALQGALRCC